jgi:hypothetical protein
MCLARRLGADTQQRARVVVGDVQSWAGMNPTGKKRTEDT